MSIPVLDTQAFRQKLAGLVDVSAIPDGQAGMGYVREFRDLSARTCCILCHLFGDSLDRTTLWERIGTAIKTAVAKCGDGDIDRFYSLLVEHVQADFGKAAACSALLQVLTYRERPDSWRQQFVRWIGTNTFAVLSHGRARWELVKKGEAEL